MKTIEQKHQEETLQRFYKIRGSFTIEQIAIAYGCKRQNIDKIVRKLKAGTIRSETMTKLNKAFDKLDKQKNAKE